MRLERLMKLAPHIERENWDKLMLVLSWFNTHKPEPTGKFVKWCICMPTSRPEHPQAFIIVSRGGEVEKFVYSKPEDTKHQHTFWDEWLLRAQQEEQAWEQKEDTMRAVRHWAGEMLKKPAFNEENQARVYREEIHIVIKRDALPRNPILKRQTKDKGISLSEVKALIGEEGMDVDVLADTLDAFEGKRRIQFDGVVSMGVQYGALVNNQGWLTLPKKEVK